MSIASPFYKVDKDMIEKVQRRARKIVDKCQHLPYPLRLQTLNLCSMTYQRKRDDMINTYKLIHNNPIHGLFFINSSQRTRGHSKKLIKVNVQRRDRHHFLTNWVVEKWNSLSDHTVSSKTVKELKVSLDKEWSNKEWRLEWDTLESQIRT
ncbi:hypothetical protein QYM36_015540 [Artemia franciscana]|uniref:Uncharacterized protein n=1 Tax=Artemia franciscana TaxID=6661 RepID=A0AA88L065_ARTSF|nr:hypothetical protein QYM36_015540 [Artemia franciscana]